MNVPHAHLRLPASVLLVGNRNYAQHDKIGPMETMMDPTLISLSIFTGRFTVMDCSNLVLFLHLSVLMIQISFCCRPIGLLFFSGI